MTIFIHELRLGKLPLIIWTISIAFMMSICVLIYPQMGEQIDEISKTFSEMGGFSQAFGMDKINFGEFIGFFGIECGNVLGLGGAFYAALLGISSIAKEEKEHTADFLLAHPISRNKIILGKLLSIFAQILIMNSIVIFFSTISMIIVGVKVNVNIIILLYLAYFIMQLEIATITFCISAFINRGGLGIGLGLATMFYFINIISNLLENTKVLKYFTPFGYTEGSDIIINKSINMNYLLVGLLTSILAVLITFYKYNKKDII